MIERGKVHLPHNSANTFLFETNSKSDKNNVKKNNREHAKKGGRVIEGRGEKKRNER